VLLVPSQVAQEQSVKRDALNMTLFEK
jgi:hypothetical protein